jgi:hypothetical protein
MGKIKESIISIVTPFAEKCGVKITDTPASELKRIGESLDAKKITVDEALPKINSCCKNYLDSGDLRKISEVLKKLI